METTFHFERLPVLEGDADNYFSLSAPQIKKALFDFEDKSIQFLKTELNKKRAKEKAGIAAEVFIYKALVRHFYTILKPLIPYLNVETVYHKIKIPQTKNFKTERCYFGEEDVTVSFEIKENNESGLTVIPVIHLADGPMELNAFERDSFFLRKENKYFLLSPRDTFTLEWLEKAGMEEYSHNPALFMERIVRKLEETNTVNRNGCFSGNLIESAPVWGLLLSEVSGSMLMMTPRFIYEGIAVEGEWKQEQTVTRQGIVYTIHRDKEAEEAFIGILREMHPSFARQSPKFFYLSFTEAKKKQWFLKAYHQLLEKDVSIIGLEMLKYFRYSQYAAETELKVVAMNDNNVVLRIQVAFGKEKIESKDLKKILLAGQNTFLLKDNAIAVLSDEWMQQYAAIFRHGHIEADNSIQVPAWILINTELDERDLVRVIPAEWKVKWQQWQTGTAPVIPVPTGIKASLRPYQQKGFEWMVLLSQINAGACLSDDMGLGKTLQSIAFLQYQHELQSGVRQIIVCPASLIHNWEKELEKFAPDLKTMLYNGPHRNIDTFFDGEMDVLICSYGTLRADIDKLGLIKWQTVIVDESHNIKNASSLTTVAVDQLIAVNRIALSGTPVMNNTFDLYAQLDFLLPGLFPGAEFFRKQYANPIDKDGSQEKLDELTRLTAPFILRRTKEQVAKDLPAKTESVLWCEMGTQQQEIYNQVAAQIRDSVFLDIKKDGLNKSKLGILQGILKLRQVCDAPSLLKDVAFSYCEEAVKVDLLLDELKRAGQKKALIFSQFVGMLDIIEKRCQEERISYFRFDGSTPLDKRAQMVADFQANTGPERLFLISLKSGNAGLNLTAAEYVFLVDPWWNAAVQQQAIDRTHRIGQTKNVFAYKMICRNTIEEKIYNIQQKKQQLSENLVAEDGFVKNLSVEDIDYLFS